MKKEKRKTLRLYCGAEYSNYMFSIVLIKKKFIGITHKKA